MASRSDQRWTAPKRLTEFPWVVARFVVPVLPPQRPVSDGSACLSASAPMSSLERLLEILAADCRYMRPGRGEGAER